MSIDILYKIHRQTTCMKVKTKQKNKKSHDVLLQDYYFDEFK